ncbi:signal peptidase I [Geodermatophilus sp. FMUSA9-8]|uniref:signal peptidase I n=1 Tax=Geodermatophilus sp. FMUSA9-8 TaxID=3120155 RepID=UPI003009AF89
MLLVVAVVLALLVKTFLAQAFFIPSGSMEQTLHGCPGCTGDRVLVLKPSYWFTDPQPGDVVVFTGPDTWAPEVQVAEPSNGFLAALTWVGRQVGVAPPAEDDFVKRVIAVAGQTVACCDPLGRVTVNGQPLEEPYIHEPEPLESRPFGPVTVPEGRLFVMGDHRSASADSTAHIGDQYGGTIAVDDVIGKVTLIVWPLGRFDTVDSPAHEVRRGRAVDHRRGRHAPVDALPHWPAGAAPSGDGARGRSVSGAPRRGLRRSSRR